MTLKITTKPEEPMVAFLIEEPTPLPNLFLLDDGMQCEVIVVISLRSVVYLSEFDLHLQKRSPICTF